jgi:hypothetical protein
VARHVRRSNAPFGGLQLVLAGDFHQLPPVAKGRAALACAPDECPLRAAPFSVRHLAVARIRACCRPTVAACCCWSRKCLRRRPPLCVRGGVLAGLRERVRPAHPGLPAGARACALHPPCCLRSGLPGGWCLQGVLHVLEGVYTATNIWR